MFIFFFIDFNLLDWSCYNYLVVVLGGFVYLWNVVIGDIVQFCQILIFDCYIGFLVWIKEGNYIVLGDSNGVVQVGVVFLDQFIVCLSIFFMIFE